MLRWLLLFCINISSEPPQQTRKKKRKRKKLCIFNRNAKIPCDIWLVGRENMNTEIKISLLLYHEYIAIFSPPFNVWPNSAHLHTIEYKSNTFEWFSVCDSDSPVRCKPSLLVRPFPFILFSFRCQYIIWEWAARFEWHHSNQQKPHYYQQRKGIFP